MLRLLRLISYPQLRASWGRTLLVVCGIATGVSLMVAINIINTTVLENFRRTIDLIAGPAQLQVTLGVGEVGFPESTVATVRGADGVLAAVPLVRGTISLADDATETLELFGADLTTENELQRYHVATATSRRDALRGLEDPHSIFLTSEFAARHGIGLNQSVRLSTPAGTGDFTVRGLLTTDGVAAMLGGRLAVMDLPAAQLLLGKQDRVDQIDVLLLPGAEPSTVTERLRAALPAVLSVARPEQRGEHYDRILASVQAMLTGISTLCLVAGIYIVYNTTSTGAVRRALVMAGLRVVGADATALFRLLMIEAFVLGSVGTLVGIAYGMLLARVLGATVADALGIIFQLRFPVQRLTADPGQLVFIGLVGVGAGLFASYFAARRVAALEPLDVIRTGVRLTSSETQTRRLVIWWLVLVAVSALALAAEVRFQSIAWGNFGSTLWNTSVIVIAIPLVTWVAAGLGRILTRLFGPAGRFAAASISRSPTRTGVTVAAVALVIGAAITFSSLSLSFRNSLTAYVSTLLAGDLVVSAVATEGGWLETPLPDRLVDELRGIPGVQRVETMRVIPGQIYRGERIGLLALSDGLIETARHLGVREGDPARAADELRASRGANVSTAFADRFGVHVGDDIELDSPTGPVKLPVVAVVTDYISDRGSVILSRNILLTRWNEPTVNRIVLFLEPAASPDQVRQRIADGLGSQYRLKIQTLPEVLQYHSAMIDRAFAFMDAIQLLIVVVTVAGILDLLLSAIAERRRELALWRLIGAGERTVRRSVVVESGSIGAIGALLGVALGLITAWMWIGINYRYLLGFYLEYHFAFLSAVWFAVLVMIMTMLAGYAAANQATRQSVLEGILNE